MLINSAEHEILNAHHKIKISRNSAFFKVQISLECYFFPAHECKKKTIVGILTFMNSAELSMKKVL